MSEGRKLGERIDFLDGFRGLAILLVVLYHAYCRWPEFVPYGERFGSIILFKQGILGVHLFFMISGFVILMTLEKSTGFFQYMYKRWLRLFPAMFIVSAIIFFTAPLLPERPAGAPTLVNVVSGLIFLDPHFIERIIGTDIGSLEGAFWSLYVEVKFYVVFGSAYFILGPRRSVFFLALLYVTWFLLDGMGWDVFHLAGALKAMSVPLFGWFATGAFCYLYFRGRSIVDLLCAMALGTLCVCGLWEEPQAMAAAAVLVIVFISTMHFPRMRGIFSSGFFVFFGFISYPLYLIHENALIALTAKMGQHFGWMPQLLLPVVPIMVLSAVAYLVARVLEPRARKLIDKYARALWAMVKGPFSGTAVKDGLQEQR